jgi:hypothetical protein
MRLLSEEKLWVEWIFKAMENRQWREPRGHKSNENYAISTVQNTGHWVSQTYLLCTPGSPSEKLANQQCSGMKDLRCQICTCAHRPEWSRKTPNIMTGLNKEQCLFWSLSAAKEKTQAPNSLLFLTTTQHFAPQVKVCIHWSTFCFQQDYTSPHPKQRGFWVILHPSHTTTDWETEMLNAI